MSPLGLDIRQTFRQIAGAPVFFGVVVLTLGLGIGANTALFSIVRTVLLAPLPYPEPDRLVMVEARPWVPVEIILCLAESGRSFEEVAAFYPRRFALQAGDEPFELVGSEATPSLLRLLRAPVALGRGLQEEDAFPGAPPTVVLGHALWRSRFGASPEVLGATLGIDGRPHEVVGVLGSGFRQLAPGIDEPGFWMPYRPALTRADGGLQWAALVARLAGGASLDQGQADLDRVTSRFRERHPEVAAGPRWDPRLAPVRTVLVRDFRAPLLMLQLAVGLVLLIACVNVANLLLARLGSRLREIAVRTALGASGRRLVRQLLTESLVLSALGGLAGLLLAHVCLRLLLAIAPADVPRIDEVAIEAPVFLFTLGISIAAALLFGVAPAVAATGRRLAASLQEAGRSGTGSARRHRASQALVVAEVALTLLLLVGAGLLARSFVALVSQEPGFRTEGIFALRLEVPESRFRSVPELERFHTRVVERLEAVAGVRSVALANNLPIARGGSSRLFEVADAPALGEAAARTAEYAVVSPGYFRTLEIPLLLGRGFEATDRRDRPPVAIVDRAFRDEVWPGEDPIGQRLRFVDRDDWMTVVGMVGNVRGRGLAAGPGAGFFIPHRQRPDTFVELAVGRRAFLLVAREGEVRNLGTALREAIREVDPHQPVPEVMTLERVLADGVSPQRFRALLLGAFAALALILVVAGVYGVVEFVVGERTRELGIRMAMGATGGRLLRSVLLWGARLALAGIALGLAAFFLVSRYLASLLFAVEPADPATLVAAAVTVLLVTLAACLPPARKAVQVDPVVVLRAEGKGVR